MEKSIIDIARNCIEIEQKALISLANHLDKSFEECVKDVYKTNTRIICTGVGKSAIIAQKIVATLNSTGTSASYLHAGDAVHGDIGLLNPNDFLCCLSKSGETDEIKLIIPIAKNIGCKIIGITSNRLSYLAKQSDYLLYTPVDVEADTNNLAPTTSTTSQMAMGDALAVSLMYMRGFTANDFAKFHPAGSLGKQLYLHVHDVYPLHSKPINKSTDSIHKVILTMSKNRLGATVVTDDQECILGIITDGDLRRMIERNERFDHLTAADIMNPNPKTIEAKELAIDALELLRKNNISQVAVTKDGKYAGMVHLHDLVKEGLV